MLEIIFLIIIFLIIVFIFIYNYYLSSPRVKDLKISSLKGEDTHYYFPQGTFSGPFPGIRLSDKQILHIKISGECNSVNLYSLVDETIPICENIKEKEFYIANSYSISKKLNTKERIIIIPRIFNDKFINIVVKTDKNKTVDISAKLLTFIRNEYSIKDYSLIIRKTSKPERLLDIKKYSQKVNDLVEKKYGENFSSLELENYRNKFDPEINLKEYVSKDISGEILIIYKNSKNKKVIKERIKIYQDKKLINVIYPQGDKIYKISGENIDIFYSIFCNTNTSLEELYPLKIYKNQLKV